MALWDLLDGEGAYRNTLQGQLVRQSAATPSGMIQGQLQDAVYHLRRGGHGVGLVRRGQVLKPL